MLQDARHGVAGEIVGVDALASRQARQDVVSEVGGPAAVTRQQQARQHVRVEQVIAHRDVGVRRIVRNGGRRFGLLLETADLAGRAGRHYAERARAVDRNPRRRHRDIGAAGFVEADHLADVHAVDVVRREHGHQVGPVALDQVEVAVHRVRGAEPGRAFARQHGLDEASSAGERRRPRRIDVPDQ